MAIYRVKIVPKFVPRGHHDAGLRGDARADAGEGRRDGRADAGAHGGPAEEDRGLRGDAGRGGRVIRAVQKVSFFVCRRASQVGVD